MVTARSAPNIALIKYWGNRRNDLRLPAADSLSMQLDGPCVEVTVEPHTMFFAPRDPQRFETHFALVREYVRTLGMPNALPQTVRIEITSQIPSGIGLASSAAVFSALAEAYAAIIRDARSLTREEVSVIARLGSGSAARSVFGGFVALNTGMGMAIDSATAVPVANEHHWPLYDTVIAPSGEEKKVSSTEGHARAATSPHFPARLEIIPRRQEECIAAILTRDFEKLQFVAEEDCWDMHRVMQSSTPPLQYLSEETHRIVREIEDLRTLEHLPVLYTMDAGPTVHLICPEEALKRVRAFAQGQKECQVFEAGVGRGSEVVRST